MSHFATRLSWWLQIHKRLFKNLAFFICLLALLSAVGYLGITISHEVAAAQDVTPITNSDPTPAVSQNVIGVVRSTTVQAKRRELRPGEQQFAITDHQAALPQPPITQTFPILMFHKTPTDFDTQLSQLQQKGYTTVSMDDVSKILRGTMSAPTKPLVITFDDGFSDQQTAFSLLKKHQMKATFYIIIGGSLSQWCLGAERNRTDCGDGYLNWQQIQTMSQSELVEIGSHTFDHPDLLRINESEQVHQIADSKKVIEHMIHKEVTTFAYPYGRYNSHIAEITQQAGYTSAVSTQGGVIQSSSQLFELRRVRDVNLLP